jgi:hypothetical protein
MPRRFRSDVNVFQGKPRPSASTYYLKFSSKILMTSELSVEEIPP